MEFKEVSNDERRIIFANDSLLKKKKEVTFIKLNKGKAIGACMHTEPEYFFVLSGLVEVRIGKRTYRGGVGEGTIIPANTAHMFYAIEHSVICEFGISAKDKKNDKKVPSMLERVNYLNDGKDKSLGKQEYFRF